MPRRRRTWACGGREDVGDWNEQDNSTGIVLLSVSGWASVAWDGVRREGGERKTVRRVSDEAEGCEMQPRKSGNGAAEKKGRGKRGCCRQAVPLWGQVALREEAQEEGRGVKRVQRGKEEGKQGLWVT